MKPMDEFVEDLKQMAEEYNADWISTKVTMKDGSIAVFGWGRTEADIPPLDPPHEEAVKVIVDRSKSNE